MCIFKKIGIEIGEDVTIYAPTKTFIDEQYPWMIKIGNHIRITEGCKFLTHDYSWSVIKGLNTSTEYGGAILGASGEIIINDNVFIGMNSIICRNVVIGENVIIGAGSVVTKSCEPNSVYVGNPAKKMSDISTFLEKRAKAQFLKEKNSLTVF